MGPGHALAIDSKLRACALSALKVEDVAAGGEVNTRGIIVQKKTRRPVQFGDPRMSPLSRRRAPAIQASLAC